MAPSQGMTIKYRREKRWDGAVFRMWEVRIDGWPPRYFQFEVDAIEYAIGMASKP